MAIQERVGEVKGWVLYDGDCPVCGRTARYFEPLLNRRELRIAPLQAPWVIARLKLVPGERPNEMRFLTDDDRDFGGADAVVEIARHIWWAYPLVAVSKVPGAMRLLRIIYRRIAARRYCINGVCEIPRHRRRDARHHRVSALFEMP